MSNLTYFRIVFISLFFIIAGCSSDQSDSQSASDSSSMSSSSSSMPAAGNTASPAPAATASQAPRTTFPDSGGGHSGVIEGVITDASGNPVAGAFVKMRNAGRNLLFMVISQDGGRYSSEKLPSGSYVVQSIGGDFQSDWSSSVAVSNDNASNIDLSLNVERTPDFPAAWPRRVAAAIANMEHIPDGSGKNIIAKNCGGCHSPNTVAGARKSAEEWAGTVDEMREMAQGSGNLELTDDEANTLKEYLASNLGALEPPDPNSRLPRHLMQGEARNYRVVAYELDATHVETHDVAIDPQGIGWANQRTGGMISRFDPETYEYTEIGPPLLFDAKRARPGNLQISPEGIMWLADPFSKRWLSYDIANEKWTDWMFPMEPSRGPVEGVNPVVHHNGEIVDHIRGQVQGNSLVISPHENAIWMAGPGSVRKLDVDTGEWYTWDSPTWLATQKNPGGYGITLDGQNRAYVAENLMDKIARYDGTTGEVTIFDLEKGSYPRRMDYDNNGNTFVGLWGTSKILKIDAATDEMTLILPPIKENGAYSIDFDKSTNLLWVTFQTADYISRYNQETEEWLMLPLPQAEYDVRRIEVDQNQPNRVWWVTNAFDARIGYLELL